MDIIKDFAFLFLGHRTSDGFVHCRVPTCGDLDRMDEAPWAEWLHRGVGNADRRRTSGACCNNAGRSALAAEVLKMGEIAIASIICFPLEARSVNFTEIERGAYLDIAWSQQCYCREWIVQHGPIDQAWRSATFWRPAASAASSAFGSRSALRDRMRSNIRLRYIIVGRVPSATAESALASAVARLFCLMKGVGLIEKQ
jgi:hypothetical protein